jgi:DNA modification methylase
MGMELNRIYNEDCLDTMKRIPDGSIDLMLQDMPYGVTQNDWDIMPDLNLMWKEWLRITKKNAAMIFTSQQPFTTDLIISNRTDFRYDLIWEKSRTTGFLNANRQPMRNHEHILLFYREQPIFNPQKTKGNPNHISDGKISSKGANNNYGNFKPLARFRTEDKFPKSVIYFEQNDPNIIIHPTQKPVDLFRWLIKTYTNEGDIVFDGYMGSGTTAEACITEKRNFIGSELNKEYFDLSQKRINNKLLCPQLF